METLGDTGDTKKQPKYSCETCNYNTSHKPDYERHCNTKRHKLSKMETLGEKCPLTSYSCENCEKPYFSISGLYKHKKSCAKKQALLPINDNIIIECQKQMNENQKQVLDYLEKKDQKYMDYLEKKDKEIKDLVIQLCSVNQANTNCHNTITNTNCNNTNTSFNLQFFLNETCKNALNLSEFIQNVKVEISDIEKIGDVGYVNGLSEVIIRNLNALGTEKRPIHCTDAKRQTLYVKEDDKWQKENEDMKHMQMLVDEVQRANLRLLAKWREMHPNCLASTSVFCDQYLNISQELMGGMCTNGVTVAQKDSKIMSKIAKEMIIEK